MIFLKLTLFYLQKVSMMNYRLWAMTHIKPTDFTVQLKITAKMYDNYMDYKDKNGSNALTLQQYLSQGLEKVVHELPYVIDRLEHEKIEVACISFGFKNNNVIKLLKKRGQFYTSGNFKKINEVNDKLYNLAHKEDKFDSIQVPVVAFITFNSSEGQKRCEKYLFETEILSSKENIRHKPIQMLGEEL